MKIFCYEIIDGCADLAAENNEVTTWANNTLYVSATFEQECKRGAIMPTSRLRAFARINRFLLTRSREEREGEQG